jgi:predicted amidohydrolase YtcJ
MKYLFLIFLFLFLTCSSSEEPDIIFYNGTILTINEQNDTFEAVAIKDGSIVAVGKYTDVFKLQGTLTKIYDLKGNTLLPGFIAAHEHPTLTAVFGGLVDVSGLSGNSNSMVWDNLKKAAETTPKGEWIYAMGLDPILTSDLIVPDKNFLDSISTEHPILIIAQSLHSFWANSKAFEDVGITEDTKDPGHGSYYQKNANGELTGYIVEAKAASPFLDELKSPLRMIGRYETVLNEYNKSGFTSVASLGYNIPPFLAKYISSKNFHPRIRQFFYLVPDELKYLPESPDTSNNFFQILGIKLWHDGSPYMGGMLIDEPYLDNDLTQKLGIQSGSKGQASIETKELSSLIDNALAKNWQVSIHSQGDLSNKQVLQSIQSISPRVSMNSKPIRIEHSLLVSKESLASYSKLGVTPSFHINHIYYYGDALNNSIIGKDRAERILPIKLAFELNMHPSLHADSPMFPANAFSLMKTATTRKTKSGVILGQDQAISIKEALRAMTINPAYQLGMSDKIGSIEVGKFADLQIINKNPYTVEASDLDTIETIQVFVNGREQIENE